MSLTPGTRLGSYEVLEPIGAGGMGDVYRARDVRLDRTVALKVVRADFSDRFEREARSISALNHPHICTLHDVGQDQGTAYLVMEYVEGRPLAGPMPVADVLRFGVQICEALEAAHKKGIVHRDLKPANILLTKSGIKLLDFGLAKLRPAGREPAERAGEDLTRAALTGAHTIVGTPQYMAPEQIEGREADARTDIFALGCVLYELLTGARAFDGKTASNVMAAVLATEPRRVTELVPLTPASLEWVVQRCLEKDPDSRWQSAADVALQLRWIADHPAPAAGAAQPARGHARFGWLTGLVAGVAVTAAAAVAWVSWRPEPSDAGVVIRGTVQLPAGWSLADAQMRSSLTWSPDGRALAFSLQKGDEAAIFLRRLDGSDAVKIAGTEGGTGAFFSPDGRWIAFYRDRALMKVPVDGGVAKRICDAPQLRGGVWLPDNTIVFSPDTTTALMRVSAAGGTPTAVTTLDTARHEKTHRTPVLLPGGDTILMVVGSDEIATYDEAHIVAVSLSTGRRTELIAGGYAPGYVDGHLLYVRDGALFAVTFDPASLTVGDTPTKIAEISTTPTFASAQFDVSSTGGLVLANGGKRPPNVGVAWVDRRGTITPVDLPPRDYQYVELSADGTRLLVNVLGANNVLWSYDIARRQAFRLTFRRDVSSGVWTPDGTAVVYWTGADVRSAPADGSGTEEVLIAERPDVNWRPQSWMPDGQSLLLAQSDSEGHRDLVMYSRSSKQLTPLVATRFNETEGRISPDGKWLAYVSDDSGRPEVYLRAISGAGTRYLASTAGGDSVSWNPNGRELLYVSSAGVMSVQVQLGEHPIVGVPSVLLGPDALKKVYPRGGVITMSPDGQRLAMVQNLPAPDVTDVAFIVNWSSTLKGRAR